MRLVVMFTMGILLITGVSNAAELLTHVPLALLADEQEAWTATLSLPLPRAEAGQLYAGDAKPDATLNGMAASVRSLGWWERNKVPRRVMVSVSGDKPIGSNPELSVTPNAANTQEKSPWGIECRLFKKDKGTKYKVVLRGGSNADSFSEWDDVVLTYKDRSLPLRFGSRREKFHDSAAFQSQHDWWQWTQPEVLLDTKALKLVRVGGLLYNEDTFHQCDIFFELFGNGVARIAAHFVNARVIGDGWEYYGIPVIGFTLENSARVETDLDGTKTRFDLGGVKLDTTDGADLVSAKFPGRIYQADNLTIYQPWKDQRVSDTNQTYHKPYVTDIGEGMVPRGMARTARFTLSLSDAPPKVAHLLAPPWLYAMSGELWNGDTLPTYWRYGQTVHAIADHIAQPDERIKGTYEAGFSGAASEGMGGTCLLYSAMLSGDTGHIRPGLAYIYNWADIQVDHVDWSVRQPFTGYYWKTLPYLKFNDLVPGWLETGDPYLLETAEHCANAYYATFRSIWPIRSIGRGLWPIQGLLELYRYTCNPYYLENALDLVRKSEVTYQNPAQIPGHQMGVGPNGIGNKNDPGDQGFAELVLAHMTMQVAQEDAPTVITPKVREETLAHAAHVLDIVLKSLPIRYQQETGWREYESSVLTLVMLGLAQANDRPETIQTDLEPWLVPVEKYLKGEVSGRPYHAVVGRGAYDAFTLGARWIDGHLVVSPRFLPDSANGSVAKVVTPQGIVELTITRSQEGGKWAITPHTPPSFKIVVK